MPEPARPLQSVPELRTGPLFRVVKETPAEVRVGRKPLHERVAPFLVEVKADPGAWFRIGTWPSASGGSSAANSLSKAQKDGKLDKKFTFAVRKVDDGSALYACYGEPKADG